MGLTTATTSCEW